MLSVLKGEQDVVHSEDYTMGWELFGRRAIRQGNWKIVWEPSDITWGARDINISRR